MNHVGSPHRIFLTGLPPSAGEAMALGGTDVSDVNARKEAVVVRRRGGGATTTFGVVGGG